METLLTVDEPLQTAAPPLTPAAREFREVFAAEESALLRFAFGITGQRETAEDLVQDAFLKLHQHWAQVEQPRAWLYRTVRNLALNHQRDHRREAPLDEAHEPVTPHDPRRTLGRLEAMGTLRQLMAELPEADRDLLELKYKEDLKYDQISTRTGMSVGNVGYKLHHLLKDLAASLRRMGIESADC